MHVRSIKTHLRNELIDITDLVQELLRQHPLRNGVCVVFIPHTTAAVTINENADPDVKHDILMGLDRLAAQEDFRHREGNSDAHLKASLLGSSQLILIENEALVLGRWQGIFLAEFDGPRTRQVIITFLSRHEINP